MIGNIMAVEIIIGDSIENAEGLALVLEDSLSTSKVQVHDEKILNKVKEILKGLVFKEIKSGSTFKLFEVIKGNSEIECDILEPKTPEAAKHELSLSTLVGQYNNLSNRYENLVMEHKKIKDELELTCSDFYKYRCDNKQNLDIKKERLEKARLSLINIALNLEILELNYQKESEKFHCESRNKNKYIEKLEKELNELKNE